MRLSRSVAFMLAVAPAVVPIAAQADPMTTARRLTSVEPRCRAAVAGNDILVCGRREADRYRVPFEGYAIGDPRGETVSGERNRLASAPRMPCGIGAFLSGCGSVGVSVTAGFDGSLRYRKLAP